MKVLYASREEGISMVFIYDYYAALSNVKIYTDKMAEFFDKLSGEKFAYVKKKQYLCSMKDDLKKYLESQTRKNEQDVQIREFGLKLCKAMLIICLVAILVAIFGLIFFI